MRQAPIYLDFAASTPVDARVLEEMLPWMRERHANPHSQHLQAAVIADAMEQARFQVARLIGAEPSEIYFTSGATEANNLAILGSFKGRATESMFSFSAASHKSVREVGRELQRRGIPIRELAVDAAGRIRQIDLDALRGASHDSFRLLSAIHGNNELGTIEDAGRVTRLCVELGIHTHLDASQSAGRISIDVADLEVDLLTLSSHKLYGPAGIGALFVSNAYRSKISPIVYGGGQEDSLRPGTVPAFLAIGFGKAAEIARDELIENSAHASRNAEIFLEALRARNVSYRIVANDGPLLPGHLCLAFSGVDSTVLLEKLSPRISASSGSACNSGEIQASHVLRSVGLDEASANEVVRVCFGRGTTSADALEAAELFTMNVSSCLASD